MDEEKAKTGIKGMDAMIGGGIPRGYSLILQGPPGPEKESIAIQFLKEGLQNGESGMIALATISPDRFRTQMRTVDIDIPKYEVEGHFKIIDWYSFNKEEIIDIVEEDSVIKSSIDLMNVRMAFNRAIDSLKEKDTPIRAVLSILSPALNMYDFEEVYDFTRIMRANFEKHGIIAIFLIEGSAHDTTELSNFYQLFDGVINIDKRREKGKLISEVEIISMMGIFFDTECRPLKLKKNEVIVECPMEDMEEGEVSEPIEKVEPGEAIVGADVEEPEKKPDLGIAEEQEITEEGKPELEAVVEHEIVGEDEGEKERTFDDIDTLETLGRNKEIDPYEIKSVLNWEDLVTTAEEFVEAMESKTEPDTIGEEGVVMLECPLCGSLLSASATYCLMCGVVFTNVDEEELPEAVSEEGKMENVGIVANEFATKLAERMVSSSGEVIESEEPSLTIDETQEGEEPIESETKEDIEFIPKITKGRPNRPDMWFPLGTALMSCKDYEEAIFAFDNVLEIDPNHGRAWNAKAFSLSKLGRFKEAGECYDRALDCWNQEIDRFRDMNAFLRNIEDMNAKPGGEKPNEVPKGLIASGVLDLDGFIGEIEVDPVIDEEYYCYECKACGVSLDAEAQTCPTCKSDHVQSEEGSLLESEQEVSGEALRDAFEAVLNEVSLEKVWEENVCPMCGHSTGSEETVCQNCGLTLKVMEPEIEEGMDWGETQESQARAKFRILGIQDKKRTKRMKIKWKKKPKATKPAKKVKFKIKRIEREEKERAAVPLPQIDAKVEEMKPEMIKTVGVEGDAFEESSLFPLGIFGDGEGKIESEMIETVGREEEAIEEREPIHSSESEVSVEGIESEIQEKVEEEGKVSEEKEMEELPLPPFVMEKPVVELIRSFTKSKLRRMRKSELVDMADSFGILSTGTKVEIIGRILDIKKKIRFEEEKEEESVKEIPRDATQEEERVEKIEHEKTETVVSEEEARKEDLHVTPDDMQEKAEITEPELIQTMEGKDLPLDESSLTLLGIVEEGEGEAEIEMMETMGLEEEIHDKNLIVTSGEMEEMKGVMEREIEEPKEDEGKLFVPLPKGVGIGGEIEPEMKKDLKIQEEFLETSLIVPSGEMEEEEGKMEREIGEPKEEEGELFVPLPKDLGIEGEVEPEMRESVKTEAETLDTDQILSSDEMEEIEGEIKEEIEEPKEREKEVFVPLPIVTGIEGEIKSEMIESIKGEEEVLDGDSLAPSHEVDEEAVQVESEIMETTGEEDKVLEEGFVVPLHEVDEEAVQVEPEIMGITGEEEKVLEEDSLAPSHEVDEEAVQVEPEIMETAETKMEYLDMGLLVSFTDMEDWEGDSESEIEEAMKADMDLLAPLPKVEVKDMEIKSQRKKTMAKLDEDLDKGLIVPIYGIQEGKQRIEPEMMGAVGFYGEAIGMDLSVPHHEIEVKGGRIEPEKSGTNKMEGELHIPPSEIEAGKKDIEPELIEPVKREEKVSAEIPMIPAPKIKLKVMRSEPEITEPKEMEEEPPAPSDDAEWNGEWMEPKYFRSGKTKEEAFNEGSLSPLGILEEGEQEIEPEMIETAGLEEEAVNENLYGPSYEIEEGREEEIESETTTISMEEELPVPPPEVEEETKEITQDDTSFTASRKYLRPEDLWLLSKTENLKKTVGDAIDNLDINQASRAIEDFIQDDLSSWYVALVKDRVEIKGRDPDKFAAQKVLSEVLLTVTNLMAPISPDIAKDICHNLDVKQPIVFMSPEKEFDDTLVDSVLMDQMDIARQIVEKVSSIKQRAGIGPKTPIKLLAIKANSPEVEEAVAALESVIQRQTNAKVFELVKSQDEWRGMELKMIPNMNIMSPVFRQWAPKIVALLKHMPARNIKEGIDKGGYSLGVEGQRVNILPGMVSFIQTLPEGVIQEEFSYGTIYLDTG